MQGDWQPLVNLGRLPELKGIQCPPEKTKRAEKRLTPKDEDKAAKSDDSGKIVPNTSAASDDSLAANKTCILGGSKLFLIRCRKRESHVH